MNSAVKEDIRRYAGKSLSYLVPLAVTVILLVWLFHKVNFRDVVLTVKEGCDWWWLLVMMGLTTLSHAIRGIRWGIQLRAAGVPRMPVMRECVSIFGAYALNLVLPRLGEVWRCVYISRREKVSLSTVVGTDFGDRGSDLVVVLALFLLSVAVAKSAMDDFLIHYALGRDIRHLVMDPWVWCSLVAVVSAIWSICHFCRHFRFVEKVNDSLDRMWKGFAVLFTMKGRWAYVFLTLGIWTCYYLQTYVTFQAFPFTRALMDLPGSYWGLIPGLVVFVFGAFSMAVPSNGGLGPWNVAVMYALSLYGISDTRGAAFSMVMWSSQAFGLVLEGIFSAIYISWDNKHNPYINPAAAPDTEYSVTAAVSPQP